MVEPALPSLVAFHGFRHPVMIRFGVTFEAAFRAVVASFVVEFYHYAFHFYSVRDFERFVA